VSKAEIKDCPFCGGRPILQTKWDASKEVTFVYMKCQKCGASSKAYSSPYQIIERNDLFDNEELRITAVSAMDAWQWRA